MASGWQIHRDSDLAADAEFAGRISDIRCGNRKTRKRGAERRPDLLRTRMAARRKRLCAIRGITRNGIATTAVGVCEFSQRRVPGADYRYEYISASERVDGRENDRRDRE